LEGLANDHAAGFPGEEDVDGLAVDYDLPPARLDEDPGHGALAPARAVVVIADHVIQTSRGLGCCAACGWVSAAYTLSFLSIAYPSGPFGSIPFTAFSSTRSGNCACILAKFV